MIRGIPDIKLTRIPMRHGTEWLKQRLMLNGILMAKAYLKLVVDLVDSHVGWRGRSASLGNLSALIFHQLLLKKPNFLLNLSASQTLIGK